MDIHPATIAQVQMGRDGRRVTIDEDVGDVARQIHAINHVLSVEYNEAGGYFQVNEACADGKTRMVLTAQELDSRVVERVRQIADPGYDFLGEVDQMDARADREKDHVFHEETGEIAERLAHAVRKDLNPGKIILPRGL